MPLRLLVGGEGGRSLAGTLEAVARRFLQLGCVLGIGRCVVGLEVVGRHDFDDLDVVGPELVLEVCGDLEVAGLPLLPGEPVVGDLQDERLQEAVLAALRRARVALQGEDLLADEGGEQGLDLALGEARHRGERAGRERLAEHGRVLEAAPFGLLEPVESGGDERLQRLRHLQRVHRPGEAVLVAALPPDVVDQAVDVLLELPRKPRLADPRDADDGHETGLALVGRRVEELPDEAEFRVAPDERRLEALARPSPLRAAMTRSARQSRTDSVLPFNSWSPASS